eukprot:m.129340 g.129340  ORF g.129340 m.129340 type:complete len:165 (+) comp17460_c0_seq1:158-652(+)
MAEDSTVKLQSLDGKTYDVPLSIARMSVTLKNMLEDIVDVGDAPIPLQTITSTILEKVIAFCTYHKDDPPQEQSDAASNSKSIDPVSGWDAEFCKVDQATLFEMILAANFLDIKPMLDLTCKSVAEMIRGKSPEDIRKQFNIKNDFTPEEEEIVRKENEWCEES